MKEELYIWHHMGMGDFFTFSGIVRHYAEIYPKIVLFYKHPYMKNVKRLYHDNLNISFIDGGTQEDNLAKLWEMTHSKDSLLKLRVDKAPPPGSPKTFDQILYEQAKVPFEYKWKKFYFERDINKEKEAFYDIIGLKDREEYIFVHDDYRNKVKTKGLPNNIKIIRPHDYENIDIFDFLYTIEQSKEVHVINSAFMCLIDAIQIKHEFLYYHEYIRPDANLTTKLQWRVL